MAVAQDQNAHMNKPKSFILAALLLAPLAALNAGDIPPTIKPNPDTPGSAQVASVVISGAKQTPWIINDVGNLKSETELTVENTRGAAFSGWVKISVAGKPDYMECLGSLPPGKSAKVVHVRELNNDGDSVTFALYDHGDGTGLALDTRTYPQQKIRRWRLYVGHNSHQDIGYTDYQEALKNENCAGSQCGLVRDVEGPSVREAVRVWRCVWE